MLTDIEFPQLVTASAAPADIMVCHGNAAASVAAHEPNVQYAFGSKFSWLVNKTCYLTVSDGCLITYELKPNAREAYLRNYILGWGLSMLAMQRGETALHCSAVCDSSRAILLCGESGSGKSTLTRTYIDTGYHLMADDMALIEYHSNQQAWVKSAFPYQKLCRDAALRSGCSLDQLIYIDEEKDKFLVPCHDIYESSSKPLGAIIQLSVGNVPNVTVQKLEGLPAFYTCVNNLFLRHLLGNQKYDPLIAEKCLKIAACTKVYAIIRPRDQDTTVEVSDVARAITDSLEE